MPDRQDPRLGQKVGKYRLVRKLGEGGFGTVYLAEDRHECTQVAVKVFYLSQIEGSDLKDFLNEARMFGLHHPSIVSLLNFGISRNGLPFLVMEYAPDGTLRDRHPKGKRVALSTIVSYVDQIASALQYAHNQRVIHRDVKPGNILIRADGTLLVSDFGIAKFLEDSVLVSRQTRVGTPMYMAPEQHMGYPCFASDQYALAVMVYEWICGVRLFQGTGFGLAVQHMNTPPPRLRDHLPELSEDIEHVILKALAKAPEGRFGRIQEFADALHETMQPSSGTIVLSTPVEVSDTIALVPSEQVPRPAFDQKPEATVPAPLDMEAAYLEPALQRADVVVSHRGLASVLHSSSQDPLRNAPSLSPQKYRLTSAPPKRWRVALVLILLTLILIGAGSLGVSTALSSKWNTSVGQPNSPTPRESNQATATAQASANSPGSMWHSRGTSEYLMGVTWSGSQFVAVGQNGTILTSPDGITWTQRTSGTSYRTLFGVAWSGSQFVVVGDHGILLTSPDGITWTQRTSGTSEDLRNVVWSGSQFVIVGGTDGILTSPDGITWIPLRISGTQYWLNGVVWSGSQFVAVGRESTILTSPDGITWTPRRTSDTQYWLNGVVWSGSQFVAVGDYGILLTSPDGITWTQRTSGTSEDLRNVVWSGSQFVIVGIGTILTSPDGITWTPRRTSDGFRGTLNGVTWSGSQFVAVGSSILISP